MDNLPFKSNDAAFEYAQKFFVKSKLSLNSSFVGIVDLIDMRKETPIYMVEIVCKTGNLFRRKSTLHVAALKHPDLTAEIKQNDLVIFGPSDLSVKIPTGFLLHKLDPEFDVATGQFKIAEEKQQFRVFVDDHFHYQDEEHRYEYGAYETYDEAVAACEVIVRRSLSNLLEACSINELEDRYFSFGQDPFVEGGDFSADTYARERIKGLLNLEKKTTLNAVQTGLNIWKYDIDHKYGLLLQESEIIESDTHLYFCQTNSKKLCVGWDKEKKSWEVNVDRRALEGLSFSTPNRFDQVVFRDELDQQIHDRKQYLIEYLFFGLDVTEIKTLTREVANGAKIEFSLDARTWNKMLIGSSVGIDDGMCKYSEKNSQIERTLKFALLCDEWIVRIEFILNEYEDYEQYEFSIKDLGGYYN